MVLPNPAGCDQQSPNGSILLHHSTFFTSLFVFFADEMVDRHANGCVIVRHWKEGVVETAALPKGLVSLTISSLVMWHDLALSPTTKSKIICAKQKTPAPASDATYHHAYRNFKGPTYRRKRCPIYDEGILRALWHCGSHDSRKSVRRGMYWYVSETSRLPKCSPSGTQGLECSVLKWW